LLSIVGACRKKPPDEFKRNFNKHRMRLEEAIVLELPEETAQPSMLGPVSHCKTTCLMAPDDDEEAVDR